jgi:hypothetical protein
MSYNLKFIPYERRKIMVHNYSQILWKSAFKKPYDFALL